jgi:type III secretion system FlhB-like substrate exporter
MSSLDKLKIILNIIKDNNITAYEIGKNTNISTFAVQKIINGDTKKPNERTLDTILQFLENAIVGTNVKINKVEEQNEKYIINNKDDLYERFIKLMEEHQVLIRENARLMRILEKMKMSRNPFRSYKIPKELYELCCMEYEFRLKKQKETKTDEPIN